MEREPFIVLKVIVRSADINPSVDTKNRLKAVAVLSRLKLVTEVCVPPLMVGEVNVLLVKVSDPARVATVPVIGKTKLVAADSVNPRLNAPVIVRVEAALLVTPVPPIWGGTGNTIRTTPLLQRDCYCSG